MNQFANNPNLRGQSGEQTIKRYVHSPITLEHNGIAASITEHGKVILKKVAAVHGEDIELAEFEVPASLIFKLEAALKMTRKIVYLSVSDQKVVASPQEK